MKMNSDITDSDDSFLVFVGRIHLTNLFKMVFIFWITANNLRKGAALIAVQIAEYFKKCKQ
jgi:aspartate-semialdehyde dehydrogenase